MRPVREVLAAVLAQAVTTLTASGVTIPPLRYIAAGGGAEDVPWDCEHLAVVPVQVRPGPVGLGGVGGPGQSTLTARSGGGALVRTLDLQLQLVRCYPVGRNGRPPSETELQAAGETLADDLAAICAAIDACLTDEAVGAETMAAPGAAAAVGPLGGMVAVIAALSVQLMDAP